MIRPLLSSALLYGRGLLLVMLLLATLGAAPAQLTGGTFRCKINGKAAASSTEAPRAMLMGNALSFFGNAGAVGGISISIYPANFAKLPVTRPVTSAQEMEKYAQVDYFPKGTWGQERIRARGGNVTVTKFNAAGGTASCTITGCTAKLANGQTIALNDIVFENVPVTKMGR
ncbi:hypothetical protein [Hymenobacter koreensis]|uniref:Uncharacterized protein n=1 Tax=Hymenobacter koreensis TaxID=1084523 RepID=A0ABP8IUI2_9BACT